MRFRTKARRLSVEVINADSLEQVEVEYMRAASVRRGRGAR